MESTSGEAESVRRSRTTKSRASAICAIASALAVTVGGCARADEAGTKPELTLTEAKAETQALELSIADAFETVGVVAVKQKQEGVLLGRGDERYQWTGDMVLTLGRELSVEETASTIAGAFDGREGFSAEVEDLQSGGPTAVVSGPDGLSFVGGVDADSLVSVVSASRCILLSGDESPFGRY